MIGSFRHKGLRDLYEAGRAKGVRQDQIKRIRAILARLDAAKGPKDMDMPGLRLHPMRGDLRGFWAVDASGNWRIIFRFDDETPCDVDLVDYH